MEHMFKKGDRVRLFERPGVPTGTIMDASIPLGIKRDDGVKANFHSHLWFEFPGRVVHDRDFSVGDWVRYEGVDSYSVAAKEGQIGQITKIWSSDNETWAKAKGIYSVLAQDEELVNNINNLVKIAPPEEGKVEKVDTVTIEHDQWGRVEGVRWAHGELDGWEKDGAIRLVCDGWREVKPRWVPVETHIVCLSRLFGNGICLDLPPGHRWKTVEIEREVEG